RAPDMDLHARVEEWTKEPEPDDVVHVQMGQQHVDPAELCGQLASEGPDPRPRVQHEHGAVPAGHAYTRRVAAVASGGGAWLSQGAMCVIGCDLHGPCRSQNIAMAPSKRSS